MATTRTAATGSDTSMQQSPDLHEHRLAELLAVLAGCGAGRAELEVAVLDIGPCVTPEEALDTLARLMVRLRPLQRSSEHRTLDLRDRSG
jgi:hypothetical protein